MRYRITRSTGGSLYFVECWEWWYLFTNFALWERVRKPTNEIGSGPVYGWDTKEEAMRYIDRLVASEVVPAPREEITEYSPTKGSTK